MDKLRYLLAKRLKLGAEGFPFVLIHIAFLFFTCYIFSDVATAKSHLDKIQQQNQREQQRLEEENKAFEKLCQENKASSLIISK